LGTGLARLSTDRALPLRAGDRAILRDPGRHAVAAGVLVLDPDPPALQRRGAAAARTRDLADATGIPELAHELARRGCASRTQLRRLGVPLDTADRYPSAGDWLVSPQQWERWTDELRAEVTDWAARNPLQPMAPFGALRRRLAVPDDALLLRLGQAAGLRAIDGRLTHDSAAKRELAGIEPALEELERRLSKEPFAAPERDELRALRLGRRELAAAERAGRVVRLADDLVLLPDAPVIALAELRKLPQPFTASAARQVLGTTRRVVIPLLEYLDRAGATERVGTNDRRVID
jgi:selenocysteine-specific elongation factor